MYDVLIQNGRLMDGTGNPWRHANVAVSSGKIAAVLPVLPGGVSPEAPTIIDATGKVVTPGFVDVHSHADFSLLDDPLSPYFVFQGLTSLIVGNCGHSIVGGGASVVRDYWHRQGLVSARQLADARQWDSLAGYRKMVKDAGGLALWSGVLMGHGTIRMAVVGPDNRPATAHEMEAMKDIVRQGMEDGAIGLSTGLDYQPGRYAPTSEIVELCKVIAPYGGIYATHTRNKPDRADMVAAVQEAIAIGERAGVPVEISHISGKALLGREIRMIEEARAQGVDVTCDAIPYSTFFAIRSEHVLLSIRSGSSLLFAKSLDEVREAIRDKAVRAALLSDDHVFRHTRPDSVVLIHCQDAELEGKTLAQAAKDHGIAPMDYLFDLLCKDEVFTLCPKYEQAADFAAIPERQLTHPAVLMGSDAGPVDPQDQQAWFSPQGSGSVQRYLALGEKFGVPMEERIRKLTSLPCQRFGLHDRGLVLPGKVADVLVFDPAALTEVTDWDKPYAPPIGMEHVIVGGVPVVQDGRQTGLTPGGILNARETRQN